MSKKRSGENLERGREKLAARYAEHGDPRRTEVNERPSGEWIHKHTAKVARDIERKRDDEE